MVKKLLLALGCSYITLYSYDLKLVNRYTQSIVIRLITYDEVRVFKEPVFDDNSKDMVLVFPFGGDVDSILKNFSFGSYYTFTLKPHQALIIENFRNEEKIAVAGTMFWKEIPLALGKKFLQEAELRRLKEHGAQRLKEIEKAGGIARAPRFKPQVPVRDVLTILVTGNLFYFDYKIFQEEFKEVQDGNADSR